MRLFIIPEIGIQPLLHFAYGCLENERGAEKLNKGGYCWDDFGTDHS